MTPSPLPHVNLPANSIMPLDHLGLIAVTGSDAADFLHNQLTNDALNLSSNQARLTGYCSPKGRLLATFLMWKDDQTIYLQCSKDVQASVQKRLSMFVLRAKAKLSDASETLSQFGLAGPACREFLQNHFDALPETIWEKCQSPSGTLIRVPDSMEQPRWLWIAPANQIVALPAQAPQQWAIADSSLWEWLEIRAGLPRIVGPTQDRFVPQMVNLEALDGVNFKKGCYPGQEVVARSQYLGKLKRRTALAHLDRNDAQPGEDVFDVTHPTEPVGNIVNIAASPLGGADALIELPQSLLQQTGPAPQGLLTAGKAAIELLPLPYVLPDQEIFIRPKL